MEKHIIITGVSRGIGKALAEIFLEKGWFVIGTSTNGKTPIVHKNLTMHPLRLDQSVSITQFASQCKSIDGIVNNAAVLLDKPEEIRLHRSQLQQTFDVNVFGVIEFTEMLLDKLSNNGQIINISSNWGSLSANDSATYPHYKLSKACLNMYTRLLSERRKNILVSSVDPGWVNTDMGGRAAPKEPQEAAREIYHFYVKTNKKSGQFWRHGKTQNW